MHYTFENEDNPSMTEQQIKDQIAWQNEIKKKATEAAITAWSIVDTGSKENKQA